MSGFTIGAAVIGVAGSVYSANKAGKASKAANQTAQQDLAFQRERYGDAQRYMNNASRSGNMAFRAGMSNMMNNAPGQITGSHATASMASASMATASQGQHYSGKHFDAQSVDARSFDMKSFDAEAKNYDAAQAGYQEVDMSGFLESFKEAMADNTQGLEAFQRRYGPIMDNVAEGIIKVSQERLSAMGRQQLTADAETLRKNFQHQMGVSGLARSGITVEAESRMAMDTAEQARNIDLNSHAQSQQLQAQGVNTLNSMEGIQQGILGRREQIAMTRGQGQYMGAAQDAQNATNTSHLNSQMTNAQRAYWAQAQTQVNMQNANLQTQASSQNAAQKTQVNMQNANNRTNVNLSNAQSKTNVSMTNAASRTNVSMGNAQMRTSVSQGNAANATNVSMQNASSQTQVGMHNAGVDNQVSMYNNSNNINHNNNISQAWMNRYQMDKGAANSFYAGVQAPNASNAINAQTAQAQGWNQQAAGFAGAAGTFAAKAWDTYNKE